MTSQPALRPYRREDLPSVVELCRAEGWPSYSNEWAADRAFGAPGVVSAVAVLDDSVVGFGYAQTDTVIQAHLTLLVVAAPFRRAGIGTALVRTLLEWSSAARMDVVTEDASGFYTTLRHRSMPGFRVYPEEAADATS